MNDGMLEQKIIAFEKLKEDKSELDQWAKDLGVEIKAREQEIISDMRDMAEQRGLRGIGGALAKVEGRRYEVVRKTHYSILAGDREAAFRIMRQVGLDSLIEEKVSDSALGKTLEDLKKQNGGVLAEQYQALPVQVYEEYKLSGRKVGR